MSPVLLILLLSNAQEARPVSPLAKVCPERTFTIRYEVTITTQSGLRNAVTFMPAAQQWPEQDVAEDPVQAKGCAAKFMLRAGKRYFQVSVRSLRAGASASASVEQRVTVRAAPRTWKVDDFAAKHGRLDAATKAYLAPSLGIECKEPAIKEAADQAAKDAGSPLAEAEALMRFTKQRLTYRTGAYKGALKALADKEGDCEEHSTLLAALCRARGIPARLVYSPGPSWGESGHVWTEVWLPQGEGGVWLPVDATLGWFGEQRTPLPVVQKGETSKIPNYPNPASPYDAWTDARDGTATVVYERKVAAVDDPPAAKP